MDDSISAFAAMRPQLERIAYLILRSSAEAQAVVDSVSGAFCRQAAVLGPPADAKAWLVSATSRLALERWPVGGAQRGETDPSDVAASDRATTLMEGILAATLVALEQLEPDARLAFLLHDIFEADLAEISTTLGRSETECHELLERARQELHRHPHRKTP